MNKNNLKLKNFFELSNLEYSKRKDEIIEGLEEKLSEISEEFVEAGTFYGSQYIKNLLKERVKRIREIVKSRLNLDLNYIEKAMIPFSDYIYQEIYKRVSNTIESEIDYARNKMLHFCRNWPYPKDYLELINQILDKEKDVLIKNTERDIQIYKMNCELELNKNKITTKQSSDYKKYKYKCYYKINIIGKDEDLKKENYIEIDGNGVSLSENNFLIFIRLILERKKNGKGWVNIKKFIEETEFKISGHYQLISRLRQNLQKILNEKETKKIIENKKSGLYRISTHPDFIIYRKKDLIKNYSNNKYITQIANQLPEI
jgi:hypothetical protein